MINKDSVDRAWRVAHNPESASIADKLLTVADRTPGGQVQIFLRNLAKTIDNVISLHADDGYGHCSTCSYQGGYGYDGYDSTTYPVSFPCDTFVALTTTTDDREEVSA